MISYHRALEGGHTEGVELDLSQALSTPVPTAEGDAAAQALADALGCSRAEAYRRAAALVARLLEEVSP
jgi:hypothetical protein